MSSYSSKQIENDNFDETIDKAPAFAFSIPAKIMGIIILLGVFLTLMALASWSVNDPSLSYSVDEEAKNWLGTFGAIIADLLFQFFGLAAFVLLLPPTFWAWRLIKNQMLSLIALRFISWVALAIIAAGFFSFLTIPLSWPLPTGLGGLIGSSFLSLATLVSGNIPTGGAAILFAILFLPPSLALLWLATFFKASAKEIIKENPLEEEKYRTGFFDIILGGFAHSIFAFKTAWRRAFNKNAKTTSQQNQNDWQQEKTITQTEPVLEAPNMAYSTTESVKIEPMMETNFSPPNNKENITEFNYANTHDDFDAQQSVEQNTIAPTSSRISAPAAKVTLGKRQQAEAQGSLLEEEGFILPELNLLAEPPVKNIAAEHNPQILEANARLLEGVLQDFGIKGDIINVRPGPVVTLYELEPAPGIKSSRVISLADDIARSMSAISARIAVVPGRNAIGIELPNELRETVYLREMLASTDFEKSKGKLNVCLGKTIGGEPIIADLARMPHLLVAGTTGSGKSVAINTMILSLLYRLTPEQCRLIMIDPKMLELSVYDGIPHLLSPVVTDPSKAVVALKWAVREMEDRYRKMSKISVRNIDGFNIKVKDAARKGKAITRTVQTGFDKETGEAIYESEEFNLEPLPYIVIIVDEMADLMMVAGKDIEGTIQRLAQMARAAGIHLVTATQRPSVDVITGTIKANFPTRISFQVTSKIDSRTILGEMGAEQLLGMGDMLYMAGGGRTRRLHGPFCSDAEVEAVVAHLKAQASPDYLETVTEEIEEEGAISESGEFSGSGNELYDKAVNIVLNDKKASTSYLQRRLSIGYNKAATLIEKMEEEGIISPANHAGKREILVGDGVDY